MRETALGPFLVAPDGALALRDPAARPALRFRWRARPVEALLAPDRLVLRALLGRVPSTASGAPRRMPVFTALQCLPSALPQSWRLLLLPDHRVLVEGEVSLPRPATAAALLAGLAGFALALAPYLDLLEEAGVVPAEGEAGTVKTCPG